VLIRPEWPYFFETNPNFKQRMYSILSVAKKKYPQLKRLAALNADDVTGLSIQEIAPKFVLQFGLENVYNERHPRNAKDYYPFLTKMLAEKPDAFMSISTPGDLSQMVKQLRELGFKGVILCLTTLADFDSFMKVAGVEASQGILGWYDDYNSPNATPRMREFQEFYTKVWKGSPEDIHLTPYITCLEVLVQALEKANTFDPDRVKQVLETAEFETMIGRCRFEGKQTYGIGHRLNAIVRVGEVTGKKFVHVGEAVFREP
ncbi:MAG: ABC transporter substrate-binding protein, partial [Thermodesulfobacteriota bacterium]